MAKKIVPLVSQRAYDNGQRYVPVHEVGHMEESIRQVKQLTVTLMLVARR